MATKSAKKQTPASTSETLVSNYEDRLDVRQARGSAEQTHRIKEQMIREGVITGRQTSPEVASLAGRILALPKDMRVKWVLSTSPEELSRMLVMFAASALGQVNE